MPAKNTRQKTAKITRKNGIKSVSRVTSKIGPIVKLDIREIIKQFLRTSIKLDNAYHDFWRKLYRNDAYVMYKNALLFYKNIQNERFHQFYSGMINKRLYTGKCIVAAKDQLKTFNSETQISSDELCTLTLQVINALDSVFESCPRIPDDTVVFRRLRLDRFNPLLNMKPGEYYRELGLLSTTLNPFYTYVYIWGDLPENHNNESHKLKVYLTIIIPKGSKGYYVNIPFTFDGARSFDNEFEIVLPRDCIFQIKSKSVIGNKVLITLLLVYQVDPSDHPIAGVEDHDMVSSKVSSSDLKKWNIGQQLSLTKYAIKYPECNWMLDIAKYSHALWLRNAKRLTTPNSHNIKPNKITLNMSKFWIIINNNEDRELDMKIKGMLNNTSTKQTPININKSKRMVLNRHIKSNLCKELADVSNFDFIIRDPDDKKYEFYEVNADTPLVTIIEIINNGKILNNVYKLGADDYTINNIKLNINSVKKISIAGDFNYLHVKATRI